MTNEVVYIHNRETLHTFFPELRDLIVCDEIFGYSREFANKWISIVPISSRRCTFDVCMFD